MRTYGTFEEKGYVFEAAIPESAAEPTAFRLRLRVDGVQKHELYLPMTYAPIVGVDVGDIQMLEVVSQRILDLLPAPPEFNAQTTAALNALETEWGGDTVR